MHIFPYLLLILFFSSFHFSTRSFSRIGIYAYEICAYSEVYGDIRAYVSFCVRARARAFSRIEILATVTPNRES